MKLEVKRLVYPRVAKLGECLVPYLLVGCWRRFAIEGSFCQRGQARLRRLLARLLLRGLEHDGDVKRGRMESKGAQPSECGARGL